MSHWKRVRILVPVKNPDKMNRDLGEGPGLIALGKWVKARGKSAGKGGPAHTRRSKGAR